jgi:hypothetical protein
MELSSELAWVSINVCVHDLFDCADRDVPDVDVSCAGVETRHLSFGVLYEIAEMFCLFCDD